MSFVSEISAAASPVAAAHFAARLSLETDCADVAAGDPVAVQLFDGLG